MKSKVNKTAVKVGMNIKLARTKLHMTQEKLSELSDISRSAMSAIERGESSPTVDTVSAIADSLDIELYKLFIFED